MTVYSVVVDALVGRLRQRPGLAAQSIIEGFPVQLEQIRRQGGLRECIFIENAAGPVQARLLAGADSLHFQDDIDIPVNALVLGAGQGDDAQRVRQRASALVEHVLAVLAQQSTWPESTAGLDVYDFWHVLPTRQEWQVGRLEATGNPYAAQCQLTLTATARRTYT